MSFCGLTEVSSQVWSFFFFMVWPRSDRGLAEVFLRLDRGLFEVWPRSYEGLTVVFSMSF